MDFSLNEAQSDLQGLARQIVGDHTDHERLKNLTASDERFDRDLWSKLADAGLLGITVGEDDGGLGLGLIDAGLVLEEVGRGVPAVPMLATLAYGIPAVARHGSPAQRGAILPDVVAGTKVLTGALIEPGVTDPLLLATTARADGDAWVLDGVKIAVPFAHVASHVVVPAATGEGAAGLFLVPTDADGVTLTRTEFTTLEPTFTVQLDGVRIGADGVLGATDSLETLRDVCDVALGLLCAFDLGVAAKALRIAADYTTERQQFDVPVASFQAVHQRAADCFIDVMAIRLTTQQALWRLDADLDATDELAIAKYWASTAAYRVTRAAVHLHGGMGVDVDDPLHRFYLWSKYAEVTFGAAGPQLAKLGERMAVAV